jgi:5-methyltetrahydrofolate--homocysteine methyltransferase
MSNRFLRLLAERPFLMADGATGTNLFAMGLMTGDAPELWVFERPDRIERLHSIFIEAGADIVLTDSFGGTSHRLKLHNAQHRVLEINREAARIARRVADSSGRDIVVAGSMGPTGELFEPLGPLSIEAGAEAFAEQASALAEGGADVLWIETMSSKDEIAAAVKGAARTGLPFVTTCSFDTNGRTMMGMTPAEFVSFVHGLDPKPVAFGANCGVGASELVATIVSMSEAAAPGDVIIAKGNCGIPYYDEGKIRYNGTPELMADYARLVLDGGARIIGGCCGTSPDHLRAIRASLESHAPSSKPSKDDIVRRLGAISEGAGMLLDRTDSGASAPRRSRRRAQGPSTDISF